MDLIIPHVGELIGGSQREENHEILLQRYERHGAYCHTHIYNTTIMK